MAKDKMISTVGDLARTATEHAHIIIGYGGEEGRESYVAVAFKGDEWLDRHAREYGLSKSEMGSCCKRAKEAIKDNPDTVYCNQCGTNVVDGNTTYRGIFISDARRN